MKQMTEKEFEEMLAREAEEMDRRFDQAFQKALNNKYPNAKDGDTGTTEGIVLHI